MIFLFCFLLPTSSELAAGILKTLDRENDWEVSSAYVNYIKHKKHNGVFIGIHESSETIYFGESDLSKYLDKEDREKIRKKTIALYEKLEKAQKEFNKQESIRRSMILINKINGEK